MSLALATSPSPTGRNADPFESLRARARRLRDLADRLDAEAGALPGDGGLAWIADGSPAADAVRLAMRGKYADARASAARVEGAAPWDARLHIGAQFARALAWMGEGECLSAFETLAPLFEARPPSGFEDAVAATSGVFAEVALRCGRSDSARSLLAANTMAAVSPCATDELRLASALLAEPGSALSLANVLAGEPHLGALATARLNLALGMWLRRRRRSLEARPHLVVARDLLRELGARPWLDIAASELRASGVRGSAPSELPLSPQELAIARLAATGFSNREIGERLYLSPRTVGSHLYRLFPKLGVTSRHQLGSIGALVG
jgi:DNA-binding CsgD family transcriptional regulator